MKVFPFYTSTAQRDDERVASNNTLLCPTWKFLPFQIQRAHLADTYIQTANLVDCDGNETDVLNYFCGSEDLLSSWSNSILTGIADYDVFISTGSTILTAIATGAAIAICNSNTFSLATGESIAVTYNMTLNTGSYPNILLGNTAGTLYSAKELMKSSDTIQLTATGNAAGLVTLIIENAAGNDTSFACTFSRAKRTNIIVNEFTTYDFITYNGEPLSTTLPYGVYYLKIADGVTKWYSEWFSIQNLQPQILTGWPIESYDTFITSGTNITSAIQAAGSAVARTNSIIVRTGEKFIFTYDLTLNSGDIPVVQLFTSDFKAISDAHTLNVGLNEIEITSTGTNLSSRFRISTSDATNFSLINVSARRKSGEYIHLEFTNTKDFNNGTKSIYYAGGFIQQAYLDSYENLPSHETIQIGDEKNGEFISEKLVSRYVRSVVSYESRTIYNALRLLPLHDDITILDEVGIEHTPNAGNVDVNMSWDTFDTGTLRLAWTENNQYWTNSMDNIT